MHVLRFKAEYMNEKVLIKVQAFTVVVSDVLASVTHLTFHFSIFIFDFY